MVSAGGGRGGGGRCRGPVRRPGRAAEAEAAKPGKGKAKRIEHTDLHFAFGHVRGVRRLTLEVNGQRLPLRHHNAESRAALRRRGGVWRRMDARALTHYVPRVSLPSDGGIVVSVSGHRGQREVVVAQLWYAPRHATLAFARTAHRLTGSVGPPVLGPKRRLKALGLQASDVRTPTDVAALETIADANTTAVTFTSVHPNIATKNPALVPPTKVQVSGQQAVGDLGALIDNMTANAEELCRQGAGD